MQNPPTFHSALTHFPHSLETYGAKAAQLKGPIGGSPTEPEIEG